MAVSDGGGGVSNARTNAYTRSVMQSKYALARRESGGRGMGGGGRRSLRKKYKRKK
jgi:hypothetical protein